MRPARIIEKSVEVIDSIHAGERFMLRNAAGSYKLRPWQILGVWLVFLPDSEIILTLVAGLHPEARCFIKMKEKQPIFALRAKLDLFPTHRRAAQTVHNEA